MKGVAPTPKTRKGTPPGGYEEDGTPIYTHEDIKLNPPRPPWCHASPAGLSEFYEALDQIRNHNVLSDDVKTEMLRKAENLYWDADKIYVQRRRASSTYDNDYIKSLSPRERQRVIQSLEVSQWGAETVFELTDVDLYHRKLWNEGAFKIKDADKRVKALKSRYKKVCKERDALKKTHKKTHG